MKSLEEKYKELEENYNILKANYHFECVENDSYRIAFKEIQEQCRCLIKPKFPREFDKKHGGQLEFNIWEICEDTLRGIDKKIREQTDYLHTLKIKENIINNLNNEIDDLDKENDKYRQAIEQIRQIVEFAIEETLTIGQKNATDKILEIIGEVQNAEN